MIKLLLLISSKAALCWAAVLLQDFHFDGGETLEDHYRLGLAIGTEYKTAIHKRLLGHADSINKIWSSSGARLAYDRLLETHRTLVPELVREIEGIADGSGSSFPRLLSLALKQELGYFTENNSNVKDPSDHCSDYMLCNSKTCFDVHNEDSERDDSKLVISFVRLGKANFTTLNYVGDLLGGMSALAFNTAGLAFSLNYVAPASCNTSALGRNFVSRLLLQAETWEEAKAIISQPHAAGHNYQLMDFRNRRISNFEVALNRFTEKTIHEDAFFHANQYEILDVPGQIYGNSSIHRRARVQHLPVPSTAKEALWILGDQADQSWPIFHDNISHSKGDLSDWTLATVFFDLDTSCVILFDGNPRNKIVQRVFHVPATANSSTSQERNMLSFVI